mgnify:CR=1 FL=1
MPHSLDAVINSKSGVPPAPAAMRLGNIWFIAATIALSLLSEEPGPHVLTLEPDGVMEAVPPTHPEYEQRLLSQFHVCTVSPGTSMERLAGRICAAATRGNLLG